MLASRPIQLNTTTKKLCKSPRQVLPISQGKPVVRVPTKVYTWTRRINTKYKLTSGHFNIMFRTREQAEKLGSTAPEAYALTTRPSELLCITFNNKFATRER